MNYEFSLDKKKAVILISGLSVLAALLFVAGFLIGYGFRPITPASVPLMAQTLSKAKLAPLAIPKAVSSAKPLQANSSAAGGNPAPAHASLPAPAAVPTPPSGASQAVASETAKASAPVTDAAQQAYSIQMGAFLDPNNAARLVKNLKGLGYDATIFRAPDRRGRIWQAVRFGRFNDFEDAMRAATEFRIKEQMFALVRPADAL